MRKFLEEVLPFWEDLEEEDKQLTVDTLLRLDLEKNTIINDIKDAQAGIKIVEKGLLRIFMTTADGGELTLYRVKEGKICVLSILMMMDAAEGLHISMQTERKSTLRVIPEETYRHLYEKSAMLREFSQKVLIERLAEVITTAGDLAFVKVNKRLAECLLLHYRLTNGNVLFMTHEELARDIGTAREVVSRTLKHFENLELIQLSRGKITICDIQGLENI